MKVASGRSPASNTGSSLCVMEFILRKPISTNQFSSTRTCPQRMLTLRRLSVVRHMEFWSRKLSPMSLKTKGVRFRGSPFGLPPLELAQKAGRGKFPVWPGWISIHTSSLTTKFCLPVQVCCSSMVPRGTTIRTAVGPGLSSLTNGPCANVHAHGVG